jgi:predicted enzyme related to lactoylglutathione lyase
MKLNSNPVSWFEIYVEDLGRAKVFYETIFVCSLIPEKTDGSFQAYRLPGGMPGNGAMGALMKHPMRKPSQEGTIVYFHCTDCDIQTKLAVESGGQIYRKKWSIGPDGFIAIIGDSEGNAIGLHSFT